LQLTTHKLDQDKLAIIGLDNVGLSAAEFDLRL
jgi:hypothetical protein